MLHDENIWKTKQTFQFLPLYYQEWTLFCLWLVIENWDKLVNFSANYYYTVIHLCVLLFFTHMQVEAPM